MAATDDEIFETIRACVVDVLRVQPDVVTTETRIREDLGADSLDVTELNMAVEDAFGMSFAKSEIVDIRSVGEIMTLVETHA